MGMRVGLQAKFIIFISILLTAFGSAITFVTIKTQQKVVKDMLIEKAESMISLLAETAVDPLTLLHIEKLKPFFGDVLAQEELLIRDITKQEGVAYAYLFDEQGRIISDGTKENRFRTKALDDTISKIAASAQHTTIQIESNVLDISKPIYVSNKKLGGVRVGYSLDKIQAEISTIRNRNVLFGAGFIVLGILSTYALVRTITRPLSGLLEGTEAISRGEFNTNIEAGTNDELSTLANSFNQMMGSLKRTTVSRDYVDKILQSMNDTLIVISPEGRVKTVNSAACAVLGYEEGELIGKPFEMILSTQSPSDGESSDIFKKTFIRTIERTYRTKDGREIPMLFSSSVMRDGDRVQGIVCVAKDITERKQIEEARKKEVLLKEIHHRIKNNLQIISTLLDLQSKYLKDEDALEIFKESQNRIRSIAFIHEKLYQSKDLASINFADYIQTLVVNLFRFYGVNESAVRLDLKIDDVLMDIDTAIPCGLIVNELVSNSLKYAFVSGRRGEVAVHMHSKNGNGQSGSSQVYEGSPDTAHPNGPSEKMLDTESMPRSSGSSGHSYTMIVRDNGAGLPEGLDIENTRSLGLKLVNTLVKQQLKGTIDLRRDGGTEFRIQFKER